MPFHPITCRHQIHDTLITLTGANNMLYQPELILERHAENRHEGAYRVNALIINLE